MTEPKQSMSQPMKEEPGNIKELSCENSRTSLFFKTVCYMLTRPLNLVFWGVTWFHLYSLCQFGRLHKNIPILLFCLVWWIGNIGYGLYLWICYDKRKHTDLLYGSKADERKTTEKTCVSSVASAEAAEGVEAAVIPTERIMAKSVKWYIKRKNYCQVFLKDKSVVVVDLQDLTEREKDFLDLKLSAASVLGKGKYRLAAAIFLSAVTLYGTFLVIRSAIPYNGELSWVLEDLRDKRSIVLAHDNIYESGVKGILEDIRKKVDLPETLCLATSFNLHFAPDGTIETFDTMLYGFDENGYFTDSYLITYNAARSKKIDVYLHGASEAAFDIDKDLRPLMEAVSLIPLEETVSAWSGEESFGILYYGTREWNSAEGIRLLNYRGECRLPSAKEYYFAGYSISVFCPDNEVNVPVRYLYVGYQEFPAEETAYTADYYPEEASGYMANSDPEEYEDRETYVVKQGDTLWKIAEEMLGSPFRYAELYDLNKTVIETMAKNQGKEDSDNGRWIFQGTLLQMPKQETASHVTEGAD